MNQAPEISNEKFASFITLNDIQQEDKIDENQQYAQDTLIQNDENLGDFDENKENQDSKNINLALPDPLTTDLNKNAIKNTTEKSNENSLDAL